MGPGSSYARMDGPLTLEESREFDTKGDPPFDEALWIETFALEIRRLDPEADPEIVLRWAHSVWEEEGFVDPAQSAALGWQEEREFAESWGEGALTLV